MKFEDIKIGARVEYEAKVYKGKGDVTDLASKLTGQWVTINDPSRNRYVTVRPSQVKPARARPAKAEDVKPKGKAAKPAAEAKPKRARPAKAAQPAAVAEAKPKRSRAVKAEPVAAEAQ